MSSMLLAKCSGSWSWKRHVVLMVVTTMGTAALSLDSSPATHEFQFQKRLLLASEQAGGEDDVGQQEWNRTTTRLSSTPISDQLQILTDSWWKIALWILVVSGVMLTVCFLGRCCYLIWDCCTDSFWGCCPRHEGCKKCLLMKFFPVAKRGQPHPYQQVSSDTDQPAQLSAATSRQESTFLMPRAPADLEQELDKEDFALRTLDQQEEEEDDDDDRVQLNMTPQFSCNTTSSLDPTNQNQTGFVTSTPMRHADAASSQKSLQAEVKRRVRVDSFCNDLDEDVSGMDESLPQIHHGHYFNLLNIFKLGGGSFEYRVARKHSEILIGSRSLERSFPDKESRSLDVSKMVMHSGEASTLMDPDSSGDIDSGSVELRSSVPCHSWPMATTTLSSQDELQPRGQGQKVKKNWRSRLRGSKKPNADTFLAANQEDFLLSHSFSNMSSQPSPPMMANQDHAKAAKATRNQRSFGLFIEEGRMGRYNPLPEAQHELWPPEQLLRMRSESQNQMNGHLPSVPGANRRRSRSMEAFSNKAATPALPQSAALKPRPQVAPRKMSDPSRSQPVTMDRRDTRDHEGHTAYSLNRMDEIQSSKLSRRPPPVPIRTTKRLLTSTSLCSAPCSPPAPPTPPPPLILEDDQETKLPPSCLIPDGPEEVIIYENTILYGRETNL